MIEKFCRFDHSLPGNTEIQGYILEALIADTSQSHNSQSAVTVITDMHDCEVVL